MTLRKPFVTLTVLFGLCTAGCIPHIPDVTPSQQAQIRFVDSLAMGYRIHVGLSRSIRERLEEDCQTPQDPSVLCQRTKSQLEPIFRLLVRALALLDQAEEVYRLGAGQQKPETILVAAVKAVLDIVRLTETLKIGSEP